jgi:hypothetical protein
MTQDRAALTAQIAVRERIIGRHEVYIKQRSEELTNLLAQLAALDAEPDEIDRLRDSLEAIHGISLDRDKMQHVVNRAALSLSPLAQCGVMGELERAVTEHSTIVVDQMGEGLGWAKAYDATDHRQWTPLALARVPVAPWPDDAELRAMAQDVRAWCRHKSNDEQDDVFVTYADAALEMARRLKARILPDGEQSA